MIETDHKPLWLLSKKHLKNKLSPMAYEFSEYNIVGIEHIKDEENVFADYLSRLYRAYIGVTEEEERTRKLDAMKLKDPGSFRMDSDGRMFFLEKTERTCVCTNWPI